MIERAAWVALSAIPGVGPARFRRLLQIFGSPLAALEASEEALRDATDLAQAVVRQFANAAGRLEATTEELSALDELGVQAIVWPDEAYPARLLATSAPPPVLWWRSRVWLTEPEAAAAVVGSREVTEAGRLEARGVAEAFAAAGIAVIGGLAAGIDAAAHEGALDCGGLTIGVCGCGIMTALRDGSDELLTRIAESGALCSELAPTAPLSLKTLYARDRIIAGLADAVMVIEARAEGGAVHTAKCATSEGRPVLVTQWPDDHPASGNRELLAAGAVPLEPGADAVAAFAGLIRTC